MSANFNVYENDNFSANVKIDIIGIINGINDFIHDHTLHDPEIVYNNEGHPIAIFKARTDVGTSKEIIAIDLLTGHSAKRSGWHSYGTLTTRAIQSINDQNNKEFTVSKYLVDINKENKIIIKYSQNKEFIINDTRAINYLKEKYEIYNKNFINNNAKVEDLVIDNHIYKIIKSKNLNNENVYIIVDQLTGNRVEKIGNDSYENLSKGTIEELDFKNYKNNHVLPIILSIEKSKIFDLYSYNRMKIILKIMKNN